MHSSLIELLFSVEESESNSSSSYLYQNLNDTSDFLEVNIISDLEPTSSKNSQQILQRVRKESNFCNNLDTRNNFDNISKSDKPEIDENTQFFHERNKIQNIQFSPSHDSWLSIQGQTSPDFSVLTGDSTSSLQYSTDSSTLADIKSLPYKKLFSTSLLQHTGSEIESSHESLSEYTSWSQRKLRKENRDTNDIHLTSRHLQDSSCTLTDIINLPHNLNKKVFSTSLLQHNDTEIKMESSPGIMAEYIPWSQRRLLTENRDTENRDTDEIHPTARQFSEKLENISSEGNSFTSLNPTRARYSANNQCNRKNSHYSNKATFGRQKCVELITKFQPGHFQRLDQTDLLSSSTQPTQMKNGNSLHDVDHSESADPISQIEKKEILSDIGDPPLKYIANAKTAVIRDKMARIENNFRKKTYPPIGRRSPKRSRSPARARKRLLEIKAETFKKKTLEDSTKCCLAHTSCVEQMGDSDNSTRMCNLSDQNHSSGKPGSEDKLEVLGKHVQNDRAEDCTNTETKVETLTKDVCFSSNDNICVKSNVNEISYNTREEIVGNTSTNLIGENKMSLWDAPVPSALDPIFLTINPKLPLKSQAFSPTSVANFGNFGNKETIDIPTIRPFNATEGGLQFTPFLIELSSRNKKSIHGSLPESTKCIPPRAELPILPPFTAQTCCPKRRPRQTVLPSYPGRGGTLRVSREVWSDATSLFDSSSDEDEDYEEFDIKALKLVVRATCIQTIWRGYSARHQLLRQIGVAKPRRYELCSTSKSVLRIQSQIRRKARAILRKKLVLDEKQQTHASSSNRRIGSLVLAIRYVCAQVIQRWYQHHKNRLKIQNSIILNKKNGVERQSEDLICGHQIVPVVKLRVKPMVATALVVEENYLGYGSKYQNLAWEGFPLVSVLPDAD
eukprot:CAMPEP_0194356514 /NCGR_PEP_ID=MMETSP0174-20130528/4144_1 /TAXON_ID=216777 /ORGANISM="Proboscia alata, Strain PI-D3" /LENGTH=901 /DNA_ID=CAMNT_0039126135 /DNA_START=25 /DNA_END=2731 /DNA_ORIENTATION=+